MEVTSPPALEALVERAGKGDADAFRTLFDQYGERVFRYCCSRVGQREDAQDVTQDVFVAVWRGLPSFRYRHAGSFPGWLFAIARNVVADHQRRALRRPSVRLEDAPAGSVEFEGRLVSERMLDEELARLPESQREVLVLRFVVGLRAREVGEAMGRSEGAVMALQVRGLDRLRRRIGGDR